MKIKSISAENFKSFSKIEVKDFLELNFIFGFNNSGKSNLLKLIENIFSRKIAQSGTTYQNEKGETITRFTNEKGDFWNGIIENHNYIFRFGKLVSNDIKFNVSVEFEPNEISVFEVFPDLIKKGLKEASKHEVLISGKIIPLGIYDAKQSLETVSINGTQFYNSSVSPTNSVNIFEILKYLNDSVLFIDYDRYFKKEIEDKSINELTPTQFRNWMFNLSLADDRKDEFSEIVSLVKDFKIPSTDKIFIQNEKSNPFNNNLEYRFARDKEMIDLFFKNEFGDMPLNSFGTGVQQIIYMIFKISETKPKILLLEEIELNLSPKYQDKLIKYFETLVKSSHSLNQIFITSHSPLNCYRSQDRSYRAEIDNAGSTSIEKFILTDDENKQLKAAHDFLIKSIYKIEEKD